MINDRNVLTINSTPWSRGFVEIKHDPIAVSENVVILDMLQLKSEASRRRNEIVYVIDHRLQNAV